MTDTKLLELCEFYGKKVLEWRNKFIGLLPEVARRKLYLQRGCASIYEFGKKFAGLSEEQVSLALNIEKRFDHLPALKSLLVRGEVSLNKLSRVVSIATEENQEELAEKVQIFSLSALKTFVRDVKPSLVDHKPEINSLFAQGEVRLDDDIRSRLIELQEKGININELLRKALDEREGELIQAKEQVTRLLPEQSSRYIPTRVKNILKKEYGKKCAKSGCQKPSRDIHHTRRFGNIPSHDPNFMAPLCKEHHQIAHSIDVKFHEMRKR